MHADAWNTSGPSERSGPDRVEAVRPPAAFRVVETASVVACACLEAALLVGIVRGILAGGVGLLAAVCAVVGGYLGADLVSGLVHFVGDRFFTVETRLLGPTFILPFRSHHTHPAAICEHDFVETNGNNAFAALFALVPTLWLVPVEEGGLATTLGLFVWSFVLAVFLTNQIHKWAHVAQPPRVVRLLQGAGVFLSPARHRSHHGLPHGGGYCVTSGLFNAILDPLGFFPRLERLLRAPLSWRARRHREASSS